MPMLMSSLSLVSVLIFISIANQYDRTIWFLFLISGVLSLSYMWSHIVKHKKSHMIISLLPQRVFLVCEWFIFLGCCWYKWDCVAPAVIQHRFFIPLFLRRPSISKLVWNVVFLSLSGYTSSKIHLNYEFKLKLLHSEFANWK